VSGLAEEFAAELAAVGIYQPDPTNELHRRLVEAIARTRGSSRGNQLVAMQWVFNWDLERQGAEFAEAKTEYEALVAKAVVRFRDAGERSGEMCVRRAEAEDDVRAAALRFRLAEQLERLARKRLETVRNQIEVWRSENADRRVADSFHARSGT